MSESSASENQDKTESEVYHEYPIQSKILKKLVKYLNINNDAATDSSSPVSFAIEGKITPDRVSVEVSGVGKLTFPIKPEVATQLTNMASLAVFGQGENTIYDRNVRDTYMIPKEKLNILIDNMGNVLSDIKKKLGLSRHGILQAHLHNLLIYKEGQFFDSHQDTEKMDGMVATMALSLPSLHIGGDLRIDHLDKSHVFSTETVKGDHVKYVAFYSDCRHKIEKVKEGFRIVLTYNLVLDIPKFETSTSCPWAVIDSLKRYFAIDPYKDSTEGSDSLPPKLIYLFNHRYTKKNFRCSRLKGSDLQTVSMLSAAAKELNLRMHFALADMHETWDDEADEFIEMEITLEAWRDENDVLLDYKPYTVSEEELCWSRHNKYVMPYEVKSTGPTGNEGITDDRWYRRAAIILWPQSSDRGMKFILDFDNELKRLGELMGCPKNQKIIREIINEVWEVLVESIPSHPTRDTVTIFVRLAIYIEDRKKASEICETVIEDIFSCENSDLFCQLKDTFGSLWFLELLEESRIIEQFSETALEFLPFLKEQGENAMIKQILKAQMIRIDSYCSKTTSIHRYGTFVKIAYKVGSTDMLDEILKVVISKEWSVEEVVKFYLNYCNKMEENLTKTFKKDIILLIQKNIKLYKDSGTELKQWLNRLNFSDCRCDLCKNMSNFLRSKKSKIEFQLKKEKRDHLCKSFEHKNKGLLTITTETFGRPYTLIVKKDITIYKDVPDKVAKLEKLLESFTKDTTEPNAAEGFKSVKRHSDHVEQLQVTKKIHV